MFGAGNEHIRTPIVVFKYFAVVDNFVKLDKDRMPSHTNLEVAKPDCRIILYAD